ncbi:MAG: LuxR family transcriptional regulator [Clostridiales bacterium GWB2_37_7]|nr:MAG: LuxR family transcriptional regulator [Clostridiales bacterium GWB2_37_7]
MSLDINKKIDINELIQDLDKYEPKRRGWHWREGRNEPRVVGDFEYHESSEGLKNYVPLPGSRGFHYIDPQPDCVITTEVASGRFEDDIRRMRMAAWHGADHIMVIRTAGQSHIDSLIEGTTQGIGGIAVTRKQVRATRKALDMIEEEVGRPINFHSYISGVAGPDIAVMFAEEGVNGAHQDPQYNVLYRNVNMIRSFVDACEAKKIMAWADMLQIDGAHNANATAMKAWKVRPELMVQHALNSIFSKKVGIKPENIALSTVPPTAPPAPCMRLDLPYAVALRDFFSEYKMRAQQNTKYMESDMREATVTHTLNLMISRLTSADIQSTITPDEGRNVPWHYNNIAAISTAKQAMNGMDGLREMVKLDRDGVLGQEIRELKERAVLFMEEMLEVGGYFKAVEQGFFIDSGYYPERNGDGIPRQIEGGIGAGMIFERDADYFAPVSVHYGDNNIPAEFKNASDAIGGDTFEDRSKIIYIDELDEFDNVETRLKEVEKYTNTSMVKPEVEWKADGVVATTIFLPLDERTAEFAAIKCGEKMGLEDVTVVHKQCLHPSEGTLVEIKGRVKFDININDLIIPEKPEVLSEEEVRSDIKENPIFVVAATVGQDEHSVGLKETLDIKHGGIEKYGVKYLYLGTSCPVEKLVDAAIETNASAILASTIITHDDVHTKNMRKIHELCVEKGIRDKVMIICGGTQVSNEIAKEAGMDAGFGRGSKGIDVVSFMVKKRREM